MKHLARPVLDRGVLVLAAIFLAAFLVLFKPWIHGFDTVAYYAWLRSVVIDGDLQVGDEFELLLLHSDGTVLASASQGGIDAIQARLTEEVRYLDSSRAIFEDIP